jgi:hypothetical protein
MTMNAPNGEAASRHTTAILAVILVSYFMILLDNSIIFTALPTSSLSLLTASFPPGPPRAKAVALYGAAAEIGASLGLVIGGALADWVSWRAGFFLNVPIGVATILPAPRYLPETAWRPGRFDLTGAVCATLGVGALVSGVIHSADANWTSPVTAAALAAGWRCWRRWSLSNAARPSRSCRRACSSAVFVSAPTWPGCCTSAR